MLIRHRYIILGIAACAIIAPMLVPHAIAQQERPAYPPMLPDAQFVRKAVIARFPGIDAPALTKFMDSHFALELREFEQLALWKPDKAAAILTDMVEDSLELMATQKRDPDAFATMIRQRDLEKKAFRLAAAVKASKGKKREEQLAALTLALQEAFKVRQELLQRDVRRMEKELGRLKLLVGKRDVNRDAIVLRKISDMTGDKDYLEW
jgi:hypothetical protein